MKIIYRHKTGFGDGTDRLEFDGQTLFVITKSGERRASGSSKEMCENNVAMGYWTKEVIESEPDYTSREYQKSVLNAAWDGIACEYFSPGLEWKDVSLDELLCIISPERRVSYKIRIKPKPATVPLEPQDWFPLGWAVRKKPEAPLFGSLNCFPVTGIGAEGIKAATKRNDKGADKGRPGFFTHSEAAELLERTRDGINFEPCHKPAK